MNIKNITREQKEKLYIEKMTELQTRWKNPIDTGWEFGDWTNDELDKGLQDIIGQLKFEKRLSVIKKILLIPIYLLILLGIIGLLLFGLRQIF